MSENVKPVGGNAVVAPERSLASITSSPHVRDKITTTRLMLYVIIALIPSTIFGIYIYGPNAAMLVAVCIITSVLAEYVYEKALHRTVTIKDLSAALTGLLLALNLPSTATWWMAVLGSIFAIIIVKQAYGGIGHNFMNPALGARCFLLISFTARMTRFAIDGKTGPTPLAILNGKITDKLPLPHLRDLFFGHYAGTIGETSVILLLLGAIFLIVMKVIDIRIPLFYIGTVAVIMCIHGIVAPHENMNLLKYVLGNVCGGGLILGAFYMATDYVSSPITTQGKIIYGILLGVLTAIFRIFSPSAEGVSYAIIISNLFVPLIERATIPLAFGLVREGGKK